MDELIYSQNSAFEFPRGRMRHYEKGRNPYDGLRPWSAITHGVGAALAAAGTVLLLLKAAALGVAGTRLVPYVIYGVSMIALYLASTCYHCLNGGVRLRIALRKLDHCSICLLIAGTYTPVCLCALGGAWGWALFGIIWALAAVGIGLALLWINCPRSLTSTVYIAMGWMAIFAIYPIWRAVGNEGLLWLLLGGVLYTAGGVLYALKWPGRNNPRFGCHEIFHVFIVLGSIAHFWLVYHVILPM